MMANPLIHQHGQWQNVLLTIHRHSRCETVVIDIAESLSFRKKIAWVFEARSQFFIVTFLQDQLDIARHIGSRDILVIIHFFSIDPSQSSSSSMLIYSPVWCPQERNGASPQQWAPIIVTSFHPTSDDSGDQFTSGLNEQTQYASQIRLVS